MQLLWLYESIMPLILFLENRVETQKLLYFIYSNFVGSQWRDAWLPLCGRLAAFMSAGVSLAVDCDGWQQFVRGWSAGGPCDGVLVVVPA